MKLTQFCLQIVRASLSLSFFICRSIRAHLSWSDIAQYISFAQAIICWWYTRLACHSVHWYCSSSSPKGRVCSLLEEFSTLAQILPATIKRLVWQIVSYPNKVMQALQGRLNCLPGRQPRSPFRCTLKGSQGAAFEGRGKLWRTCCCQ